MKLDPRATLVVVPVALGGGRGARVVDMALDTGATYVMIPWHVDIHFRRRVIEARGP